MNPRFSFVFAASLALSAGAHAQSGTYSVKAMTPELATKAATAAMQACRDKGYQIGVAVVDRAGVPIGFVRDRFAGPHTVDMAINKAWTAVSFKTTTLELAKETQAGKPMSGIRALPRVIAAGGGVPVEAAGSLLGAIGVSGGPGGEADEACAKAGIKAIEDQLDF
ncbi:MAG: hypothetical protein RL758_757 [Pseudomonadota bacterium]|jgi:uncharacterized protein GlcG (DUF336 family)